MKIFKFIPQLDCFIVEPEYKRIANQLGLNEWNEVVWIGRFFTLDNDYGEHWFDNWEGRDKLEQQAKAIGIDYNDLLIIDPERLRNNVNGPCHTELERKNFWTDVLKSLDLSLETIIAEAIKLNNENKEIGEPYIENLNEIIMSLK
ncbi:conserved hypothetical protein [Flavobacterium sp. 9AF]|uniref:hypothetical protein n=1 Tax=Flavobacterium sp. 9AF TaxID=2653142 RepID=UPI0012F44DF1|nr:hypothetical protein [Flavobacterium sp. 9AF]VXB53095.1 conserved hypothetical protein [Flavobacterium sp. 9AF]